MYIDNRSRKLKHAKPLLRYPECTQRGFTLVELLVTLSLLAILTSLAVPSFSETIRQWRRDSATRAFTTHLQMARAEAIKSSRKVVICTSSSGTACAGNSEWKDGWLIFLDLNGDKVADADERVVAVSAAVPGIESMTSSGSVKELVFLPNGLLGTGETTVTITPKGGSSSTKVNKVTISRVGRALVTSETPS